MRLKAEFSRSRKGSKRRSEAERWNADILNFAAMSSGAIENWIIPAAKMLELFTAADAGVQVAGHLISVISQLLDEAERRATGDSPVLCMNCETAFHPSRDVLPGAFIVRLPFANPKGGLASALCERCTNDGSDWHQRSLEMLKQIFPDAYRVEYPATKQSH